MIQTLLLASSAVSAILVLSGFVWKIAKAVRSFAEKYEKDQAEANYCRLWTLRQAIVNPEFPLSERKDAGEHYIAMGSNGYIKHYLEALDDAQSCKARANAEETL